MALDQPMWMCIGTYTKGTSEGVYTYRLDPATGALSHACTMPGDNPSFVALSPAGDHLYAINEIGQLNGQPGGGITAYALDRSNGQLRQLNQQSTVGPGPCHVHIDATGRYALAANYGGGSACILPIAADGSLQPASDFIQHQGSSVNPARQQEPHAHMITTDPGNNFVFVPDLGLDKIVSYRLDLEAGKLVPHGPTAVAPGSGPRHLDFHPNGRWAYVITEILNTVIAFDYDAEAGTLSEKQTLSTLPAGYDQISHTADIHVHPSGRFLYGSNRGDDSLAIYTIDPDDGTLSLVDITSTLGPNPRNFAIDPSGTFLFAASQNEDRITTFTIDPDSGRLSANGQVAEVGAPVCMKLISIT
ncbi:MAG: beta-propeller fold lactonase family protein [Candidatus Latescibacteria bacterium]|nr:beta-propeller fold lactonase family protein [Candidatus Latescibacterota bacterium]